LMLLDEDLNFKKDLAKCDSLSGFINDDGVAFFMKNYNGDIMSYDPRTDKVNDEFAKIPFLNYFYGTGYELFGASGSSLKSIDTNTGEIIKLFEFTDVNVSGESFQDVFRDGAGNIHLIYMKSGTTLSADGKEGYSTRYYNCDIKRYEKGEISEPEEIWIACNYMGSETEKAINEYNLAHPETKIRTKCYYDDYADFSQGIDAFDRDLLDNVNFDLVLLSMGFDSDKYTSKGLFEDLMPYIERDPSFDVKDYYENALFANKEGNKMFSLPVSIYLEGYEGDSTVFGDKETLSINDIIAARANYPDIPFISYGSNSNVLFYMLDSDYRLFLGTKEGTYDFNTDEFRKLLELAATFPTFTEDDYRTYDSETNIIDGKEKLTKVSYYGVLSYVENRARFGKNFKSYGTASLEGNGYYISPEESLAIMSTSTHKEEAWEIIKEVLNTSSDFSGYSFSIKRDTFKADLEASYKQVKLGFNISYEGGHTITLSMTEEDKVFLESLIDGAVAEKPLEGEVRAIISDEIKYFFNKEKSLDDTIKIISSRVNLFMKEKE
ncbi:MAG: hypothetical protein IKZ39_00625, partial [Lachnospiraceae bacterium]|nr:hypothetical protein [Lachnospiraceae bacterium]